MSVIDNSLLLTAPPAAGGGGYQIQRSLRFNAPDSAFLSRTPTSAGNRKTWTWAGWVKKVRSGSYDPLFTASLTSDSEGFRFSLDKLQFYLNATSASNLVTTQVFRDLSAWMHIQVAVDTTQATANNRVKIYVNGSQVTAFDTATYPAQNYDCPAINTTALHWTGNILNSLYASFYLADVHFIDGQALTPSSFTETNAITGQLIPKAYSGSYGSNGWKLSFSNNSTAAALGTDTSANGNTWTVNNLSVTAGSGNDSLVDTPTSYGTDTGVGGEVRGNYCTWNPLPTTTAKTFSDGNLQVVGSGSDGFSRLYGTFGMSSGKWYFEVVPTATSGDFFIGISASEENAYSTNAIYYYSLTGAKGNRGAGGGLQAYGSSYSASNVIGVAVDMNAGNIWFAKNGIWQASGNPATGTNPAYSNVLTYLKGAYVPYVTSDAFGAYTVVLNAGQRAFAYTAPSGFKALCDTNLSTPVVAKPNTVMDVKLYTGNGGTQTISGLNFDSDFLWIKRRDGANSHQLTDTVRGLTKYLFSDATLAEETRADQVTATSSTGFSLGSNAAVNASAGPYVAWAWDAGTSTVTNTVGSITSQVRANASAGFSVVTYTGLGSAATVGHGLGVAPSMIIAKSRSNAGGDSGIWVVYHKNLTSATNFLYLNDTSAQTSGSTVWNSTAPTSTVFSIGSASGSGSASTHVAYCFAPVAGYSSFGSYTGNGSTDGPFVYTGFRPRWILIKSINTVNNWQIFDTARDTYNVAGRTLYPNLSNAEDDYTSLTPVDILSSGFKLRTTSVWNTSATNYIYAAFAESPFQYARAR